MVAPYLYNMEVLGALFARLLSTACNAVAVFLWGNAFASVDSEAVLTCSRLFLTGLALKPSRRLASRSGSLWGCLVGSAVAMAR